MFSANGGSLTSPRMESAVPQVVPFAPIYSSTTGVPTHDDTAGIELASHSLPDVQTFQASFLSIPSSQRRREALTSPTLLYTDWTNSEGPGQNPAWPSLSQIDPLFSLDGRWKREEICHFEPKRDLHTLKRSSGSATPVERMTYQDPKSKGGFRQTSSQKRQAEISFHEGLGPSKKRRTTSSKRRNCKLNNRQAKFCALWLLDSIDNLFGPKQLKSLGALVNAPEEAISSWMNEKKEQLMSNPPLEHSGGQTSLAHMNGFGDNRPTLQSSTAASSDQSTHSDSLEDSSSELSEVQRQATRRKGRGPPQTPEQKRCHPSADKTKLSRNDNRPFQCTRKCGKTFEVMKNWVRHEIKGFPPRGEMCMVGYLSLENDTCLICQVPRPDAEHMRSEHSDESKFSRHGERCGEEFYRPDHLTQHFGNTHKALSERDHKLLKSRARFDTSSQFPTWCGFCEKDVGEQKEIFPHIRDHFVREKKCMSNWVDEVVNVERPQVAP